jgi:hypothetical protein
MLAGQDPAIVKDKGAFPGQGREDQGAGFMVGVTADPNVHQAGRTGAKPVVAKKTEILDRHNH